MRRKVGEAWLFFAWLLARVYCAVRGHTAAEEIGVGPMKPLNRAHRRKAKRGKTAVVRHTHAKLRCRRCKTRLSHDFEA